MHRCLALLALVTTGCAASEDPQAVCTQVEVTPAEAEVARVAGASTWIALAVCTCPDSGEATCPDENLMPGRFLSLEVDRGTLTTTRIFLRDGRGEVQLAADPEAETATVEAWTSDGFVGGAVIQYVEVEVPPGPAPLAIAPEQAFLASGESLTFAALGDAPPEALRWSSNDEDWLTCDGGEFADCAGRASVEITVDGDPWAAGLTQLAFWVTDTASQQQSAARIVLP